MIVKDNIKTKIEKMPKALKASAAFFIASVVSMGMAYITTPVFTRLLSTTEYGQVAIYNTWCTIFGYVAMFSLSGGVFNNGMSDYPGKRNEYSFSLLGLSNVITIVFSAVVLAGYPLIKDIIGLDFPFMVLMCISFIVRPAYQFWYTRQRYELNYKNVLTYSMIIAFAAPIASIVAILLFDSNRLYARIFGSELTIIIICIFFYIYLGKHSDWMMERSYWKSAFLFNLPLLPHYLSVYLLGSLDRIMISNLVDDSATAFYSVAYSLSAIAMVIWSAINGSLIPYTYENCKEKNYSAINAITIPVLVFFGAACIFIIMLGPEVVRIMATEEYMEAIYVIPPIIGGSFFQVQYSIYANIVYYYKKPKYVMIGSVTAVFLNFVLNYFFITKYGYIAAGYTTLGCYFIQAVIDYLGMRAVVKTKVYDMKIIVLLSLVFTLISISSVYLYSQPNIIRYCILIGLSIIGILSRKKIVGFWRSMKK